MTPASDQPLPTRAVVLAVALVAVVGLALLSLVNPRANVPIVSQVVCSVRGLATDAAWYDGELAPAGCYDASPDASSGYVDDTDVTAFEDVPYETTTTTEATTTNEDPAVVAEREEQERLAAAAQAACDDASVAANEAWEVVNDAYMALSASYDNDGDGFDDGDVAGAQATVDEAEVVAADADAHATEVCSG